MKKSTTITYNIETCGGVSISELEYKDYDKNLEGEEFKKKYGFKCPTGVRGRNSDNTLYRQKIGWVPSKPLKVGIEKTFNWISKVLNNNH